MKRRHEWSAFLLLLGVQTFFLISGLFSSAPTCDEPNHLAAGLAALSTGDFRFHRDHPPLQNLLCALPAWALHQPQLDYDNMAWERGLHLGLFSKKMNLANPKIFEQIFFAGRFGTVFLTLALSVSLFLVVRRLFGTFAAFVGTALLAFEPNILTHGRLITTDMAPTLFFFLSTVAFCHFLERYTTGSAVILGLALGAGLLAKHSVFTAVPAFIFTAVLYHAPEVWRGLRRKEPIGAIFSTLGYKKTIVNVVLITCVAFFVIWAGFAFEVGDPVQEERAPNWGLTWGLLQSIILPIKFFVGSTTGVFSDSLDVADPAWVFMRRWLPMFDYFEGFLFQIHHARDFHNGYLMGKISSAGWWYYYPVNFLIKTPVSLILASIGGFLVWWKIPGMRKTARLCFTIPAIFYFFCICVGNNANIGWRHALPVVPFLCLWAGALVKRLEDYTLKRFLGKTIPLSVLVSGVLIAGSVWSAVSSYPDALPYVNGPARSIAEPIYWTADSNLDWGQDLRRLKQYVQQEKIDHLYLLHFGAPELVQLYGIPAEAPPRSELDKPGIYAISASILCGLGQFGLTDQLRELRQREPDAIIGASIFVYDLRSARPGASL